MTDTSRNDGPRTEAGRRLLRDARRFWTNLSADAILAIEAEAAAGQRDEGLDVERLGKAMIATGFWPRGYRAMQRKWPAMVAAEYAALAGTDE